MLQSEFVSFDFIGFSQDAPKASWGSQPLAEQILKCLAANALSKEDVQSLSSKPLLRSHLPWHVSASSVVFRRSPGLEFLVLFHAKAKEWVYPGGHADGQASLLDAALKEVEEETSLVPVRIWFKNKQDLMTLPDFAQEILIDNPIDGKHVHLDIVYCFEFGAAAQVKVDLRESKDYRWITVHEFVGLPEPTSNALRFFEELLSAPECADFYTKETKS